MDSKCFRCNTLPGEIPGMYLDFDADPEKGGEGVPLCPVCLGTGKVLRTPGWIRLQKEAELIRAGSLYLQLNDQGLPREKIRAGLQELNGRLKKIAAEALGLIGGPVPDCFALRLRKDR